MSSIDERGRRAGADLRRAAGLRTGPPLDELTARSGGRTRRAVAVGLVRVLVAGGAWSLARSGEDATSIEVRGVGSDDLDRGPRPALPSPQRLEPPG